MATFSVLILTVAPPGLTAEPGGPFTKIDGRESLLRAVEAFLNRDNVKQIQIVFTAEAIEEAKRKYAAHLSFSGVKIITAGPRWMDQLAAAKDKIAPEATHVIVHDAARCAVPYNDIDALMDAAEKHAAVALTCPLRAPLVEIDEGGNALAFQPASQYLHVVHPQVFSRARFEEMAASKQEPHASQYAIIKGSPLNLRLSAAGDAAVVKALIGLLPKPKAKGPATPFDEAQW